MVLLTQFLTVGNFIDSIGPDLLIALGSIAFTIFGAYILMREKLLKNEIKTEQITQYIDNQITILENKIQDVEVDVMEFKDANKEITKSLSENTAAIRELKSVLNLLIKQLNLERNYFRNRDEDDI